MQSLGDKPQWPRSRAEIFAVDAGSGCAATALAVGAPPGSGADSLTAGNPTTFFAILSTGSRALHATTASMAAQETSGATARSMMAQRLQAPPVSLGGFDRVIVAIEFAGAAGMKGDRLDRLVLWLAQTRQHFEHLVLPHIDRDRNRDPRRRQVRAVGRLADAVGGRRQPVIGDALHVIAGVDDDRPA